MSNIELPRAQLFFLIKPQPAITINMGDTASKIWRGLESEIAEKNHNEGTIEAKMKKTPRASVKL